MATKLYFIIATVYCLANCDQEASGQQTKKIVKREKEQRLVEFKNARMESGIAYAFKEKVPFNGRLFEYSPKGMVSIKFVKGKAVEAKAYFPGSKMPGTGNVRFSTELQPESTAGIFGEIEDVDTLTGKRTKLSEYKQLRNRLFVEPAYDDDEAYMCLRFPLDFLKTGKQVHYYENGQKKQEWSFKKTKEHGKCTTWYINGKKRNEYEFANDKLLTANGWKINGEKNGTLVRAGKGIEELWSADGKKKLGIWTWVDGARDDYQEF